MANDGKGGTALSDEQVERYARNPIVLYVGSARVILTLGFRQEAYDAWEADPRTAVIRRMMLERGIDERDVGRGIACALAKSFRQGGRPTRSNAPTRGSERLVRGAGWYLEHPSEDRGATVLVADDERRVAAEAEDAREPVTAAEAENAREPVTAAEAEAAREPVTAAEAEAAGTGDVARHNQCLTDEQVERYAQNPGVLYVGRSRLILTLCLRREAYDAWEADPRPASIHRVLLGAGIDEREIGRDLAHDLAKTFKEHGRPKRSNAPTRGSGDCVRGAGWNLENPGAADDAAGEPSPCAEGGARARKSYSDEEIERYARSEGVLYVGRSCLILTLGLRRAAYDAWVADPRRGAVAAVLAGAGVDPVQFGRDLASDMARAFERHGRPRRSNVPPRGSEGVVRGAGYLLEHPEAKGQWDAREALLSTGRFVESGARVWPSPELEDALFAAWPQAPVAAGLADAGYDEGALRMGLAQLVEARLRDAALAGTSPALSRRVGERVSELQAEAVAASPFVEATPAGVRATPALVASAAVLALAGATVDDVLEAHLLDRGALSVEEKAALARQLALAEADAEAGCDAASCGGTVMGACVLGRREALLERLVRESLAATRPLVPTLAPHERKRLCQWADALPGDPAGTLTKREVMGLLGISKTSYYRHLKDDSWGTSALRRAVRDEEDAESVRLAFGHRGFRKGARQVCMLIPRLGRRKVGLRRVRRIMGALGLESGIRAPNPSRRAARSREEASVAPNLLRRRFRLHRPNEVRVTDVTTLDYGDGLRAYGSALMDPVTSVVVAFVVSDRNDLDLALDTLREGDAHPCCEDGGVLHSDQGVLYKAGEFRDAVLGRGLERSMSRRGNCWDNATVESFFGHFKDECDYASCATLDELRALVADYADYHNDERGMWDRGRMTPTECEAWLSGLGEEEFGAYLEREEAEWEAMRARAAERARRRYGTLGAG